MKETGEPFEVVNVDDEGERFTLRPEREPDQTMILSTRGIAARPTEWLYRVAGRTRCVVTPPPMQLDRFDERPEQFTITLISESATRLIRVRPA